MYILSEPPHRVRLNSSNQLEYVSISSDYSQTFVFISTPTTINFYTANIVFELISQYTLTDEQSKEFGFIVDIKSSQTLPLLSVLTDNNYLLILTYEKDLVESFEKSNSDGSLSTPKSSTTFLVSGELHLLMIFSLVQLSKPIESTTTDSNIPKKSFLWDKNLLNIKTKSYLLALDFVKIASSKVQVLTNDKSTQTHLLTINNRDITVGGELVGHLFLTIDHNTNDLYDNSIGAFDNHIFYKDLNGKLVSIGHSGSTIIADDVGPFAVSSVIAYSNTFGNVKLITRSKSGTFELVSELVINGDVKMLSWCPKGRILAIIYTKSTENGKTDPNRLGLYSLYTTSPLTTAKIHFSYPFNIAWSSLGLRLFLVTTNSIFLYDVFRASGWHSGFSTFNDIMIGPSSILVPTKMTCAKIEAQYLKYDYPISISPYWPFILAFSNPSLNLMLIRSHNGALLLCSKEQRPLNVTSHFIGKHSALKRKPSLGENTTSIVYLNRHWRLLEFQLEIYNTQEYDPLPCCWINDDIFLSVGISDSNLLNNVMKLCRLSKENLITEARLKIRRSPILAKRVDFINYSTHTDGSFLFYLLTRFDKVEVYSWTPGTDLIQIVVQIDLSFPSKLFNVNGVESIDENSSPSNAYNRHYQRDNINDYYHLKSMNIQSIIIKMESENNFKVKLFTDSEMVKIVVINGRPTSAFIRNCNIKDNILYDGANTNRISNNAIDSMEDIKKFFELSKQHFEKKGKLGDLKLVTRKDQIPNSMLMRICRMSLEYLTLDDSIFEVFDLFIESKDYLNASLILICIQDVVGVNDMVHKYAKPLLLFSIKALGHQPSLINLIKQLIRILETMAKGTDSNILESVNDDIIKAAGEYVLYDFLGLIRVVLLLKLPLVNVISSTKLEWRLSDCEIHFGNNGITLKEMVSLIKDQFFISHQKVNKNGKVCYDGWSLSSVSDLILPIYHVCLEAGANSIAFAIALSIGDKGLAQLSVNGHIASEIDRLDTECSKCKEAKKLIALVT